MLLAALTRLPAGFNWTPVGAVVAALVTTAGAVFVGFLANARDKRELERIKAEREILKEIPETSPHFDPLSSLMVLHRRDYLTRGLFQRQHPDYVRSWRVLWIGWFVAVVLPIMSELRQDRRPSVLSLVVLVFIPAFYFLIARRRARMLRADIQARLNGTKPWSTPDNDPATPSSWWGRWRAWRRAPALEAAAAPDPAADPSQPPGELPAPSPGRAE